MKNSFSLPVGIKEYTTTNVNKIEFLCSTILEESELWGYKKIITPIFETLDSLNVGLRQESLDKTIKFIDPMNGDVLGLRSDVTPQIARYVASNNSIESMPLRLTYVERVIRNNFKEGRSKREIFQVGCELIGLDTLESDLEAILLGSSIIDKLGFDKQVITLNSSLFLNYIFSRLPDIIEDDIKLLFYKKDYGSIRKYVKDKALNLKQREFMKKFVLPIIEGKKLPSKGLPKNIREGLDRIKVISKTLEDSNASLRVQVDLLNVKDFDYYSDITFDIAVPEINEILLAGGRYNNLIGKYGKDAPAIGFGINVLPLIKTLKSDQLGSPIVVIENTDLKNNAVFFETRDFFSSQGFISVLSNQPNPYSGKFDLKIKISKTGQLTLFSNKNKKIASFKGLSDLQKEEF